MGVPSLVKVSPDDPGMTSPLPKSAAAGLPAIRSVFFLTLALLAFAYMRIYPVALLLLVFVGGGTILAAASANTILQTIVDDRLRGRVASFYTLAFLGVAPLGNLAAGAIASVLGTPFTFALNGALAVFAALWFRQRLPMVRDVLRPIYEQLGVPKRAARVTKVDGPESRMR